jgi:hypothetical protein
MVMAKVEKRRITAFEKKNGHVWNLQLLDGWIAKKHSGDGLIGFSGSSTSERGERKKLKTIRGEWCVEECLARVARDIPHKFKGIIS